MLEKAEEASFRYRYFSLVADYSLVMGAYGLIVSISAYIQAHRRKYRIIPLRKT